MPFDEQAIRSLPKEAIDPYGDRVPVSADAAPPALPLALNPADGGPARPARAEAATGAAVAQAGGAAAAATGGARAAAWAPIAAGVAAWAGLVAAGRLMAVPLQADDFRIHIGNPPLVGSLDWHPGAGLLGAIAIAAAAVAAGPRLAVTLRWRILLASAWGLAGAWAFALAAADGFDAVSAPLETRYEYLHDLHRVGSPGEFLATFTSRIGEFATHTKGHPPGFLVGTWLLDQAGVGGSRPLALLVIALGALAAAAALAAARALAGERHARAAAPFVALSPAAIWIATSADAAYLGLSTVGLAALAVACVGRGPRSDAAAAGAGALLGIALISSYGVAPLGVVALAIALATRRVRPVVIAGAAVAAVLAAAAAAGFWWLDGLQATHDLYASGIAGRRPYTEFLVINLAAFALALGPAAAAGLAALRGRAAWWLPGAALVAVAAADLSGLSRGETERIWLPFTPWILLAAAALASARGRPCRGWIAAQAALALALAAGTRSPW